MKELYFDYRMHSGFSTYITDHSFTLKCIPPSDEVQQIKIRKENITPVEWMAEGRDAFGNPYIYGNSRTAHESFDVEVEGYGKVNRQEGYRWDETKQKIYCFPTILTTCVEEMEAFVRPWKEQWMADFREGSGEDCGWDFKNAIFALMESVYHHMEYCPGTTDVRTSAAEAFAKKKGVCQDYAHIMIALCRYCGVPAAYVAGYMIGEGASHAWVTVCDRRNGLWYEIDPTNDRWVDDGYIHVSRGYDASDCIMNKGVYQGFATETQDITVVVKERAVESEGK
ncbi:MAG: transglutaminase family protein [Clostridiales bacterium]|nr:transglutaminase family protein [Clostridiales bacterium]